MINKTEGFVLKSFDFRETSKIVTFFTKEHGKLKGVMKGIRKDSRKFGSNVDKFSKNEIVYYEYRRSELHLISQCDLKCYYFPIRQDYQKNLAANYVLELVDAIMQVEEQNEHVYQLLENFLESLETAKEINKLIYAFQVKILLLSGFKPHLDSCVVTGQKITGRARFSVKLGGLVSPDVKTDDRTFHVISRGTINYITHIEQVDWKLSMRVGLTPSAHQELKFILNNFLVYHLEKKIKAAKYL